MGRKGKRNKIIYVVAITLVVVMMLAYTPLAYAWELPFNLFGSDNESGQQMVDIQPPSEPAQPQQVNIPDGTAPEEPEMQEVPVLSVPAQPELGEEQIPDIAVQPKMKMRAVSEADAAATQPDEADQADGTVYSRSASLYSARSAAYTDPYAINYTVTSTPSASEWSNGTYVVTITATGVPDKCAQLSFNIKTDVMDESNGIMCHKVSENKWQGSGIVKVGAPGTYYWGSVYMESDDPSGWPPSGIWMMVDTVSFSPQKIETNLPSITNARQVSTAWAQSQSVSATVTDSQSGVRDVWLMESADATSGYQMTQSGNTWTGTVSSTGTWYVVAFDKAGNKATRAVNVVNIDRTGPSVSNAKQNTTASAASKTVSATVTDSQSGVDQVWLMTTSTGTSGYKMTNTSGSTWTSPDIVDEGTYYIWAIDKAGNPVSSRTAVSVTNINRDRTGPTITNETQNTADWARVKTVSATITDASGIKQVLLMTSPDATSGYTMTNTSGNTYTSSNMGASGTYYIWAMDNAGNVTTKPVVITNIDRTPPDVTNAKQNTTDYARTRQISATITDSQSGVKQVLYTTSEGATSGYSMTKSGNTYTGTVSANGTYYIVAIDNLGNRIDVPVQVTNIDKDPPTVSASQDPVSWAPSKTIKATITDVAGVKMVLLATSPNASSGSRMTQSGDTYTSSTITTPGTYYIIAIDNVGNRKSGDVPVVVDKIDPTPPTLGGASISPSAWSSGSSFTITATGAADTGGAGVEGVYYSTTSNFTSGGTKMSLSGSSATATLTPPANAQTTYYIRVKDNAGNWSAQKTVTAKRDTSAPVIDVAGGDGWASSAAISATVTDEQSGITQVFYATTSGATSGTAMTAVGSNVYRSQELPKGTYYIVAINGVGLRSEARVTLDRIDTEPPTVTGTATITPTDWTNGKHTITVTGISDTGGSGVAAVFYATSATATSGTNLTYNEATGTATLTADLLDGSHTYYLRVKDGAGNFAAKTLSVVGKRDTTDPTVTPAVSPAGWAAAKTVSATVRDTQSGIKSVFLATAPNAESGTAMSRSGNTYTAPAVSKTGTYYVVAIDQAGNRKEASIAVDQIDVNKPTVTGATISPTGWTNGNHTVTVSGIADTGGSGIAQVFLATSATATSGTNMEYNAANGTATVTTALAEGTTTYYIRVKDGAGNFSDAVPSVVAKRDSAPPVISGARPSGGILTATVTDAASGVNRVFYSTTSGATSGTAMTKSGDVYTSAKISGAGIYYIVAYDNAGARSEARVDASDLVAPTFTGASINPSAWSNGASFTITASGISDTGGSGVASAFYSTSSSAVSGTAMTLNAAKTQATVTLTPPANAQTTYYLYIVDGSGNISSPRSVVAKRDTAAPTMSGATISPDTWTTQTTFTIRVTGIADTGGSGVSQVFYSTTENATSGTAMSRSGSTASATITAPKSQETKYYIRVKDAAGNLSTQQVVSAKNVQPGVDGPEVVAVTSHINTSTTTGGHSIQARIKAGFVATKGPEVTGAFMTFDPNATSGTNMSWSDGTGYGYWNGYLTNSENRPVYYIRLVDSAGLVGPAFEVSALEASLVFRTNHGNLTATISPSRGYVTTKKVVNVVATNVASYVTNVRFNFVRGTNDSSATTTIPMTKSGTTWTGSADITDNMQIYFDAYFDGASSSEGKGKTSIAPEPLWRSISNIDPAAPTITNVEQSTTGWVNSTTISAVVQDPDTHTDQYSRSNSSGIREVFWSKTSGATSGTAMSGSTYDSSSSPYKYKYTSKALTSPGTYYIVAYDNAGNRTQTSITLKNLDATAPTMTAASIDPSAWTDTSSFTITATGVADTGGSGVEGVYYSTTSNFTSGGTKMTLSGSTATATLTPPDNASTTYYVRVKDNAGNWSTQKSVAAKRDSSSPSITNAKQSSDTWGESKTISATVTDTGSGLKSVFWSKTSGATSGTAMTASGSTYTSGAINEEGTYYIVAYDNAGHRSQQSVTITKIDLAAPSMTGASISPDSWSNADSFTITATGVADTGSAGVEGVYYSTTSNFTSGGSGLADVFWTTTSGATEGNLMMDNGDVYTSGDLSEAGTYYIVAYDVAGNRTQTQVVVSNIDMEAPTVSGASILPAEWSNAESFTLTATGIADTGGSNVEGVYYSTTKNFTSGGTKMALTGNTATASITPPVNASTTYYVRVKDNAGNWSTQVSAVAKRDTAAPAITNVQNNAGQILATITDSGGSGLKSVFWSATDGATSGTALTPTEGDGYMTEPGALADNGAYYIVAYDNAGNRSQYAINVSNIDKEAPTFTGLAIDPASWSNAESFTLTATGLADTGGSGVAEVFCSTSSGAESGTRMTISGTTATLTLTPPANAQTTYYVRVKDGAGNLSAEKSIVAKRDTTIPSLTGASINPADWSNGSNYTITVEGVSDMGGSDVEGVYYSTEPDFTSGGTKMTLSGGTSTATFAPPQNMETIYYIRVRDNAGNWSEQKTVAARQDTLPPEYDVSIDPSDWSFDATFTINVTNVQDPGGSGIGEAFYSTVSGAESGISMMVVGDSASVTVAPDTNKQTTYYVRVRDNAGNLSEEKAVTAKRDTGLPTMTGLTISPTGWNTDGGSPTYTLTATGVEDFGGSGVKEVFYTTDANATSGTVMTLIGGTATATFVPPANAHTTYYVFVKDNAGNLSTPMSAEAKRDSTAPVIAGASIDPADWSNADSFTITATGVTDAGSSEIAEVFYSTTSGATSGTKMTLSGDTATATLTPPANAQTTYYIRAKDNAGNLSNELSVTAKRDTVAPVMNKATISPEVWSNGDSFLITAEGVLDTGGSEIAEVFYATDANAESGTAMTLTGDTATATLTPPENAATSYYVRIKDHAGNLSRAIEVTAFRDTLAPTISKLEIEPTGWSNGSGFTITASGIEDLGGSGIAQVFYSTTPDATTGTRIESYSPRTGTASVTVTPPADAQTTYYVRAIDKAGNLGPQLSVVAKRDTTAPTGSIKVGEHNIWSAFVNAITFGIYFNEQQPVVIDAADEGGSGLAGIQYYIASEALTRQQLLDVEETSWKDYAAFTLLPEDRYVVYAKLADNAGNVTYIGTDGMVFDTTAPVVGAEDTVDVTPPWAHIGAETVTVTASGVEDVMKTGLVSGETDVMSDIAYAYLMKTAGSTADVDIVGTFAKQEDGTFTCAMSPTEAEEIYYLRAVDNAGNWNDPSTSVKVTLRADLVAPVMENIRQEIVAGNVLVRVDATDVGSGMDKVYVAKTPDAESGVMLSKADENEYSGYLLEGGKLYLIAADKAGNRTVSELTELDDMDHIPPEITNVTANGDSTVSADITDTGSGVGMAYLSEDKDAETGMIMTRQNDTDTYVSPRVETGKTYYVIAYDKAGNRAVAEITIDAQPDKTRPVITGVQSPEDPAYGKVIVATANDPAGRQGEMVSGIDENRVYLLTSDDASATEGTPLTRQDDGTYVSPETRQAGTYYVFCYDKAGNRSKNAAVVVDAIVTGGGTPIRPSGAGGIDTYYQGGGSGAAMDSTKALVWMGGTLFRTMETGAYLAEDLVGQTQFHGRTSTNYSASLLLPEMETFAQTVSGTPGLRTIDLPDVDVKGQTAYPLHHGPSTTDTTDSELLNTAYFPQGNTSRAAGLKDTPTSGLTWWSRTGYKTTSRVWAVNQIGQVQSYTVTGNYGIRPEVYLDHTQAFFVPASAGGGAPESGETLVRSMGAFKSVSAGEARIQNAGTAVGNAQTYRVFTLDGTNAALPENRITASATSDGSLIIRYEGASHGADNYLSAMLVNKETHEKWTARLGNIPEANGEQAVSLPHVDGKGVVGDSNYLLYVWNENEAGRNACSPLQFEMSDLKLPDNPKIVKITQQPEDWTGASEEKTITAEATFAENCTQKKLEIAQNADGSGEKYTLTANADGTYSTTQVKTGGIWYVIATDGTNKLSAVQPFDVKIDTTPPTITSAGLGHGNTLYATAEDAQSGMGSMYWSQSADGTGLQEMTLSSGAYVSQELLGLGIYYVYAVDAVGNRSLPTAVEVSALYDTTPPDISNIVITQQEDGRFKVSFKVEDIAKAPEPASGVKPETVMWKSRKEGEYTAAQLDPEHADGSHYYFLTDDSIENTAHYIYAEDWAGNAAEKEAVNQTGVISVSIPVKMLFAALPDTYGGKFYAPEYTVTNNSETNKLNVSLVGFEADESSKGFELVAPGTKLAQNQMTLYLSGLGDTGGAFGGLSKTALLPGGFDMEKRLAIGNLAKAVPGADGADGKYTFAGDIPEYNLMQLQTLEALRAKFQMTLLFEKDYTG